MSTNGAEAAYREEDESGISREPMFTTITCTVNGQHVKVPKLIGQAVYEERLILELTSWSSEKWGKGTLTRIRPGEYVYQDPPFKAVNDDGSFAIPKYLQPAVGEMLAAKAAADETFKGNHELIDGYRRIKLLRITGAMFVDLFRLDGTKLLRMEGMPADAKIFDIDPHAEIDNDITIFRVHSMTFPVVPPGGTPEELRLEITETSAAEIGLHGKTGDVLLLRCSDRTAPERIEHLGKYLTGIGLTPVFIHDSMEVVSKTPYTWREKYGDYEYEIGFATKAEMDTYLLTHGPKAVREKEPAVALATPETEQSDILLYGCSYTFVRGDGRRERLDPQRVLVNRVHRKPATADELERILNGGDCSATADIGSIKNALDAKGYASRGGEAFESASLGARVVQFNDFVDGHQMAFRLHEHIETCDSFAPGNAPKLSQVRGTCLPMGMRVSRPQAGRYIAVNNEHFEGTLVVEDYWGNVGSMGVYRIKKLEAAPGCPPELIGKIFLSGTEMPSLDEALKAANSDDVVRVTPGIIDLPRPDADDPKPLFIEGSE